MIRVHRILDTPSVTLAVFDHPPGDAHQDPEHEVSERHSISFVEQGSFDVRVRGELWRFVPGTIFVTERELEFSCTHDTECPDDRCLSVGYGEQTVEDLLVAGIPAARGMLIENCGHAPMAERPAEFARILQQFLGPEKAPVQ